MTRILINTPQIDTPAGVSNHYLGLRSYFSGDVIYNQYKTTNYLRRTYPRMPHYMQKILRGAMLVRDILKFVAFIFYHRRPHVLLNPSFVKTAMQRDLLFLKIAKALNCKVSIFIHGWDHGYFNSIRKNQATFTDVWNKADCYFVLASEFKSGLRQIGIEKPIHLTTTKVNDSLIQGFEKSPIKQVINVLFLARVTRKKGIYTTIDAFMLAKQAHKNLKLTIVGMGELDEVKKYAQKNGGRDIEFTGPLSGESLRNQFSKAHIYILPTHSEGMPTSVLEAMAFGLPVITRPVGGIVDFFEEGCMGYLIESTEAKEYAARITLLANDPENAQKISQYNQKYARQHFLASKIAKELENTIKSI